jgi:CDP-diacylglycerol---serine O-phosphatidyltransferase
MKQIPNLFTLLNLVFGCLALIFILQSGEIRFTVNEEDAMLSLPEKIWWGSICIGIAAIIDFLDGFVARMFNATSDMGKQLDSLADLVSFGVAPGMILYQLLRITYIQEPNGLDVSMWALVPALIFPCAGAYRLARFNLDTTQEYGFKGVPIPAAGLVVASLPLIIWYNYFGLNELFLNKWFLYFLILIISFLMVSTIPFMALKFKDMSVKNNLSKLILVIASVTLAIIFRWLAVPLIFIMYLLISILDNSKKHKRLEGTTGT